MKKVFFANRTLDSSFDMTPIIDVVFLLIIFFMLVFQFIAAENFAVTVPDKIQTAQNDINKKNSIVTISVIYLNPDHVQYAVGAEQIDTSSSEYLPAILANAVDTRLAGLNTDKKLVCLRCDKKVPFEFARPVLEGISQSTATDIQWSVIKK